jgi:chemotaxis protein methyltransferase CheR
MREDVTEAQWQGLSDFIAQRLGLHFPPTRRDELRRGFASAMHELGFDDLATCIRHLLSVPPTAKQDQVLATHLTIGETYFFRERQTLQALADTILPDLIKSRRGRDQRLRIWSAACCSGEEAYSLAILLHRMLPDLEEWRITIIATDINPHFLKKAAAGIYSKWSFRGAPDWLKGRYFEMRADGDYALVPEIKKLVTFQTLNLAEDGYSSSVPGISDMDIVFCRNVLMYFTPALVLKVIRNIHRTLGDGGWLAVSPSEANSALFPDFRTVNFPGTILFQKHGARSCRESVPMAGESLSGSMAPAMRPLPGRLPDPAPMEPALVETTAEVLMPEAASPLAADTPALQHRGGYAESAGGLSGHSASSASGPEHLSRHARMLANQGQLREALAWCDRWIAADKLNAAGHYLRAVILQEQGKLEQARTALQRAVYLDQHFVLAHFALGSLARRCGESAEQHRHFANTRHLLHRYQPDDPLPESDGLSAGRLAEILSSLAAQARAS